MRKTAFVFPGQGSQYVGMGKDFFDCFPEVREVFRKADERLGLSLSELILHGPEEELRLTVNTQPAILTVSVAMLEIVKNRGIVPAYVAGHSLGEYSALVAAGALEFEDAVWLVRERGKYMQEAVPPGKGVMAAILGLTPEQVEGICREAAGEGVVEPANYNSPGQLVIAGEAAAVQKAVEISKKTGAKRAVMLPVSGPFHSSLLKPASVKLEEAMRNINIRSAKVPVIANTNAQPETNPEEIRENLIRQVSSPVRWQQSVEKLLELGVNTFVEIGPGKVLSGLIKKIAKNIEMYNIEDEASLEETFSKVKGVWR